MDNGIVQVTLSKPGGIVTGVRYNGIDNLLEVLNDESNRGYRLKFIIIFEERLVSYCSFQEININSKFQFYINP